MIGITELARVTARGADSLPYSQGGAASQAQAMKDDGFTFFVGYLGAINKSRILTLLALGMAFMPVTFGGAYVNGATDEIAQLQALGIPPGTSVWLDMEGLNAFHTEPTKLISMINMWADGIAAAGYMPCLYVGVPQPLTSAELYALRVVRYWKGQGSARDRFNNLVEPKCGWCMTQMWPSVIVGHAPNGVLVDGNMIGQDYQQRVPTWVVQSI
jgi:hypothetical protein